MVRAILESNKSQTRRVVGGLSKRFPLVNLHDVLPEAFSGRFDDPFSWGWAHAEEGYGGHMALGQWLEICPYGVPGDRLWVRETSAIVGVDGCNVSIARAERMPEGKTLSDTDGGLEIFRVEPEVAAWASKRIDGERWRPSIFMPRWACRLVLEVTGVRAQRLQEISEEDAYEEGCFALGDAQCTAKWQYELLWERINGKGAWSANPWVWVVEFKRV